MYTVNQVLELFPQMFTMVLHRISHVFTYLGARMYTALIAFQLNVLMYKLDFREGLDRRG